MLLDDMLDYLSSGGVGTPNVTLFAGALPDESDDAVCVYETGGLPSVKTLGGTGAASVAVERPSIEVVSRAVRYQDARLAAHLAFRLLDGMPARLINGVRYQWAETRQNPFPIGRDEAARFLIGFNVDLIKGQTTTS